MPIYNRYIYQSENLDGQGSSGGGSKAANPLLTMPDELIPEAWKDNVRDLRRENASYRERAKNAQEMEAASVAKAREEEKKAADELLSKERESSNSRIIRAELKAEAIKAGMIDMDGLKLADLSKIKLDDNGEVVGAEELMKSLKESKPYLFKAGTTSSTQDPPKKKDDSKPKTAQDMTDAEWKAEKRKLGLR